MGIDLKYDTPAILADEADLQEIREAVTAIEAWEDRHGEVLDYIYARRLMLLIHRRADLDEVLAFYKHLRWVAHPLRREDLDGLDRPYFTRWQAYVDVLETVIARLRGQDPEGLMERPHVAEILELAVDEPGLAQDEVAERIGLKKANLSRIMALMEENDLLERRREGRRKRVYPGPRAPKPEAAAIAEPKAEYQVAPRGMSYLSDEKAA